MKLRILPALFTAIYLCFPNTSFADDVQDYWSFIEQFESLDRVQVDCIYTRSMTLNPTEDVYINAEARGPYQYIVTEDGFRVEVDIVGRDEPGEMLGQRGVYSFDGSIYKIFLAQLDTSEDRTSEPFAGTDFPLNPLLFPVSMLRNDLDGTQLLDVRHFRSRELIEQNIKSIKIKKDADSNAYLHIELNPERNREYSDKIDSHYRVYMKHFDSLGSDKALPKRLEMIQDSVPIAIVQINSYVEFQTSNETVFLPSECGFVLIEGDEATVEYRVDDIVYSQPPTQGDLYAIGRIASNHIDINATLNQMTELPDGAHDDSVETRALQTDEQNTTNSTGSLFKIVAGLSVVLIGVIAGIVLIKNIRNS